MSFIAMYPGRCVECEGRIEPGHLIDVKGFNRREYRHALCPEIKTVQAPTRFEGTTLEEMGF